MTQHANWYLVNGLLVWINKACDGPGAHNVAGIIKHLLDRTSPSIIFIWSGKVILGLGFASPNITIPDQMNMILVSVLSIISVYYFFNMVRLLDKIFGRMIEIIENFRNCTDFFIF